MPPSFLFFCWSLPFAAGAYAIYFDFSSIFFGLYKKNIFSLNTTGQFIKFFPFQNSRKERFSDFVDIKISGCCQKMLCFFFRFVISYISGFWSIAAHLKMFFLDLNRKGPHGPKSSHLKPGTKKATYALQAIMN